MKNILFVILMAGLFSCSHSTENKINNDIAKQPDVTSRQAVDAGREAIALSKNLTFEQKEKMLTLMEDTRTQVESIRQNESQVKSSLFKYIATGEFGDREIRVYRKKLIDFENQKLNVMFSSLKETRKILGKDIQLNPDIPGILDFQGIHVDLH